MGGSRVPEIKNFPSVEKGFRGEHFLPPLDRTQLLLESPILKGFAEEYAYKREFILSALCKQKRLFSVSVMRVRRGEVLSREKL